MPQKTGLQSNLLMDCEIPGDITRTDGAAAMAALLEWGGALNECAALNAAKAAHIRRIHQLPD